MSDSTPVTLQKKPRVVLYLCLAAIGYLGYKLHLEEQRTTPTPQQPLSTFESRIEPLREHASDWDAGYFFLVGNHENRPQIQNAMYMQPQPPPHPQLQPRDQSGVYDPSQPPDAGNEILRSLQQQNAEWDRYVRQQQRQQQWQQQQQQQLDEW